MTRPEGVITRGTTHPNRLRRVDRWLSATQAGLLRRGEAPLVVDLGFGASPVTCVELFTRLRRVQPAVEVIGLEIDPERVIAARPVARPGLSFAVGGFELPVPRAPLVVRAFNVLRQYDEPQVSAIWRRLTQQLAPHGLLVEGTCDELGRLAAWITLDDTGPQSLTVSLRLRGLSSPSAVAPRLPKALIHRNVAGEPVHDWLRACDEAWARQAAHASFGVRARWLATCADLRDQGWPVLGGPGRWRLGELGVAWSAVQPRQTCSCSGTGICTVCSR